VKKKTKKLKTFDVCVRWQVVAHVLVKADSEEEAIAKVEAADLPMDKAEEADRDEGYDIEAEEVEKN